jgi:hypothetical protein
MKTQFRTTTKAELIAALDDLNDNDLVAFASNYGDITSTMQVHPISGNIDEHRLCESAYSDSGYAIADDDRGDDEEMDEIDEITDTPTRLAAIEALERNRKANGEYIFILS